MTHEVGILNNIKGDMNRLGYLKIITSIVGKSRNSPEVVTESLERICTVDGKPRWEAEMIEQEKNGLSKAGMIPSATSKSYIEFAHILGLYDPDAWVLGGFGIILEQISDKNDNNELNDLETNPLVLKDFEKIFFWNMFITKDGQIFIPFIKYIAQKIKATRKDMMDALMEEEWGYLKFLEDSIADRKTGWDLRNKRERQLKDAKNFRTERISAEARKEWNVSKQYALYRHFADPKIHWLVDLGFLRKANTTYEITDLSKSIIRIIEELESDTANGNGESYDLLTKLSEIFYPNLQPLPEAELMKKIVAVYESSFADQMTVKKTILCDVVFFTSIKQGESVSRQQILNQMEKMLEKFPMCVSNNVDTFGKPIFIHIEISKIKELL